MRLALLFGLLLGAAPARSPIYVHRSDGGYLGRAQDGVQCGPGLNCYICGSRWCVDSDGGSGSSSGAPTAATYITQTAHADLSAEQAMGSLGTGLVLNTTTTGVQSIYAGGTCSAGQYVSATSASGALTCSTPADTTLPTPPVCAQDGGSVLGWDGGSFTCSGAIAPALISVTDAHLFRGVPTSSSATPIFTPPAGRCWVSPVSGTLGASNSQINLGYGPTPAANATGIYGPYPAIGYFGTQWRSWLRTSNTAAQSASLYQPWQHLWIDQGFLWHARWGSIDTSADARLFAGLNPFLTPMDAGAGINNEPSNAPNTIYAGCDSGDTNLKVCSNDASGTATCTDLGASFPCHLDGAAFDVWLYAAPGGATTVDYAVKRLDSAAFASGTISSDLPSTTLQLAWHVWMNNGPVGADVDYLGVAWVCAWIP